MKKPTIETSTQPDPSAEKKSPDPEVVAFARRRQFSASYKRAIVRQAAACNTPGAIGELLRREGLYSSHLTKWRKAEAKEIAALQNKPRGPKPDAAKALDRRIDVLEQANLKLRKKLDRAEQIIAAQKNFANCWVCQRQRKHCDGGSPLSLQTVTKA